MREGVCSVRAIGHRAALEFLQHHVGALLEQQLVVFVQQQQANETFDTVTPQSVNCGNQFSIFYLRR